MAKGTYASINGTTKKIKKWYVSVGGVIKKIKKMYVVVGGVIKAMFSGEPTLTFVETRDHYARTECYESLSVSNDSWLIFGNARASSSYYQTVDTSLTFGRLSQFPNIDSTFFEKIGDYGVACYRSSNSTYLRCINITSHTSVSTQSGYSLKARIGAKTTNHLVVAGGANSSNSRLAYAEAFDSSLSKQTITSMSVDRITVKYGGFGDINGYALIVGGSPSSSTYTGNVDYYSPALTRGTLSAVSNQGWWFGKGANYNYIIFFNNASNEMIAYNKSLTRSSISNPTIRGSRYGTYCKEYAVFYGGQGASYDAGTTDGDLYDLSLTKTSAPSLPKGRVNCGYGLLNNYLLVIGGTQTSDYANQYTSDIFLYAE